jgi:hypothetical protein
MYRLGKDNNDNNNFIGNNNVYNFPNFPPHNVSWQLDIDMNYEIHHRILNNNNQNNNNNYHNHISRYNSHNIVRNSQFNNINMNKRSPALYWHTLPCTYTVINNCNINRQNSMNHNSNNNNDNHYNNTYNNNNNCFIAPFNITNPYSLESCGASQLISFSNLYNMDNNNNDTKIIGLIVGAYGYVGSGIALLKKLMDITKSDPSFGIYIDVQYEGISIIIIIIIVIMPLSVLLLLLLH